MQRPDLETVPETLILEQAIESLQQRRETFLPHKLVIVSSLGRRETAEPCFLNFRVRSPTPQLAKYRAIVVWNRMFKAVAHLSYRLRRDLS